MKKSEISESCAKLFAGEAIVEPEVRDAALAWVPDAMRFLAKTEADDLEPAEGDPEEQAIVEPEDAEDVGVAGVDETVPGVCEIAAVSPAQDDPAASTRFLLDALPPGRGPGVAAFYPSATERAQPLWT